MIEDAIEREREILSGDESFVHFMHLMRPMRRVYEAIGLYSQLASIIDLHLRRIYFALRAKGDNERGPERAHLADIFQRLPRAIQACELELEGKAEFLELTEDLARLLKPRNDVIHSSCRWQPAGDLLVFAHANEKAGAEIKTGDGMAFWVISQAAFLANVAELDHKARFISQFSWAWLPALRPWLKTYWV